MGKPYRDDETRRIAGYIFTKTKANARVRDIPVTITVDDVVRLLREQDLRCAVTGIRFDHSPRSDGGRVRPFLPSVDRKNARGGYSADNVRIVCAAVNAALGDWGDDVFRQIIIGAANKLGVASVPPVKHQYPKGVIGRPHPNGVRFESLISWQGKRWYLGTFPSAVAAGEHYSKAEAAILGGDTIYPFLPRNTRQPAAHSIPSKSSSLPISPMGATGYGWPWRKPRGFARSCPRR